MPGVLSKPLRCSVHKARRFAPNLPLQCARGLLQCIRRDSSLCKPCCCSVYEALAAELVRPLGCAACTLDAEAVAVLNDKIKFSAFCERMGMRVPRSFPVTSRARLSDLNER